MAKRVAEILSELRSDVGKTIKICQLLKLWEGVVDERVGRHTEAVKIRNRVLFVSTSSPAWAQELTFLKKEIIDKFNCHAGKFAINDIKFKCQDVRQGE